MAVAAVIAPRSEAAEYARNARLARFAALFLDGIFLSLINALVNSVYGVTVVTSGYFADSGVSYLTTTQTIPTPLLVLLDFAYFIVLETMFGATLGKQLMRLRVVRLGGRPLTVGAVVVRNLLRTIDFLPAAYVLGGIFVLGTARAQRLGDIAAGTTVVYRHRVSAVGRTHSSSRAARFSLFAALVVITMFSIGFDYFGRPPLVIEGLVNEHNLFRPAPTSYILGRASWGAWTVTYPITFATATQHCSGSLTMRWEPFDWQMSDATYTCPPS